MAIHATHGKHDRRKNFRHAKNGKSDSGKPTVSIYGDTAIAVVRGSLAAPAATHYTLTLSNQVGGWKAVALHTTN